MNNSNVVLRKNFLFDFVYRILQVITPLITAPYIARTLGASAIGDYSFSAAIVSYFTIVAILGSNTFGRREIAYCVGKGDNLSETFWTIFTIRLLTVILTCSVYVFFIFSFHNNLFYLFLIQIADILGLIFDFTWYYEGIESFDKLFYRNLTIKIISIISVFVFVKNSNDLYIYVIVNSFAVIFGNLTLIPPVINNVGKYKFSLYKAKKFFAPILKLFIPAVTLTLYNTIDKTMIGIFSDSYQNGYYEQAMKIITIILSVISSITNVISPRVCKLYSAKNIADIKKIIESGILFLFYLALPCVCGMWCISNSFVPIFFGPGYDTVISLINVLMLIIIPIGLKMIIGMGFLVQVGNEDYFSLSIFIGLVGNVILNSMLIPNLGAIGASYASIISEFIIVLILIYHVADYFDFRFILTHSIYPISASLFMYCALKLIKIFIFDLNNLVEILIFVLIGFIIYMIVLFFAKDKELLKIIKLFKEKRS